MTALEKLKNTPLEKLKKVARDHKEAASRLAKLTKATFPEGTIVCVTLGRSRIRGTVLRAGGYSWSNPDDVQIENERTGKLRIFAAASSDVEIL